MNSARSSPPTLTEKERWFGVCPGVWSTRIRPTSDDSSSLSLAWLAANAMSMPLGTTYSAFSWRASSRPPET